MIFVTILHYNSSIRKGEYINEIKEVIARAKKVWVDAGYKIRIVNDLKTMDLYLKPEENAVYYVFNEEESGSFPLYE